VYAQYKRHLEDPFDNLTRRHPEFFSGGHVIDAGANIGYTAGVFAARIDPRFCVWAYEPSSENFARLEQAIERRHLRNVIARRAAVADRAGAADLILNPDHPGDHHLAQAATSGDHVERVPVITIDDEVRANGIAPVAFVKIDVQGHELHVCRGMTHTLDANPSAAVVVEYAPELLRQRGADPKAFGEFFSERGYHGFRLMQRGTLAAMPHLPATLPAPGYADILFTRTAVAADRS
jgi:FkbM family methyltransferase